MDTGLGCFEIMNGFRIQLISFMRVTIGNSFEPQLLASALETNNHSFYTFEVYTKSVKHHQLFFSY